MYVNLWPKTWSHFLSNQETGLLSMRSLTISFDPFLYKMSNFGAAFFDDIYRAHHWGREAKCLAYSCQLEPDCDTTVNPFKWVVESLFTEKHHKNAAARFRKFRQAIPFSKTTISHLNIIEAAWDHLLLSPLRGKKNNITISRSFDNSDIFTTVSDYMIHTVDFLLMCACRNPCSTLARK